MAGVGETFPTTDEEDFSRGDGDNDAAGLGDGSLAASSFSLGTSNAAATTAHTRIKNPPITSTRIHGP
jgi:hypothetical protein